MEVHMLEKTTLKNKGELMICTIWCSYSSYRGSIKNISRSFWIMEVVYVCLMYTDTIY